MPKIEVHVLKIFFVCSRECPCACCGCQWTTGVGSVFGLWNKPVVSLAGKQHLYLLHRLTCCNVLPARDRPLPGRCRSLYFTESARRQEKFSPCSGPAPASLPATQSLAHTHLVRGKVSLCIQGWPRIHNPPASASLVLGSQMCTTIVSVALFSGL